MAVIDISPKLSVIVPVYNVEKYIRKSLDSILEQTYSDFELIIVDDGSTDSCPAICDEYNLKDDRIKVIHKENGGLMSAWICGVENAKSEYVVFVDSDDWIGLQMFEIMVNNKFEDKVDMVICNSRKVEGKKEYREDFILSAGYYNYERITKKIYPIMINAGDFQKRAVPVSRCGKLIRKNLIENNLKYCDKRISFSEDFNIIFPVLLDCKSIVIINNMDADYYYRMNPNSILHTYNKNMYKQIIILYDKLFLILSEKNKNNFSLQLYADYIAAIVQCYKNELMNPSIFKEILKNIGRMCNDKTFIKALDCVEWKHYRKLNVLIIRSMKNWNFWTKNIITRILWMLKKYKIYKINKY